MTGRPTKLTDEVAEKIFRAIRAGNFRGVAARSAGVGESTFFRWMERGRTAKSGRYRDFYEGIVLAEAESEVHAVAVLRKAMSDNWRAAIALLERRHSWRNREGSVPDEERPPVDLSNLTERDLKALERIYGRLADNH